MLLSLYIHFFICLGVSFSSSIETSWTCVDSDDKRSCRYKKLYFYSERFIILTTKDNIPNEQELAVQNCNRYWDTYWQPDIKVFDNTTEIQRYLDSKSSFRYSGLHLFFEPYAPVNVGHALFDGLYPAFVLLLKFGLSNHAFTPVINCEVKADNTNNIDIIKVFSGQKSSELLLHSYLIEQSQLYTNNIYSFDDILFGVGGVGDSIPSRDGGVGGEEYNAMQLFRNRMYIQYNYSHYNLQRSITTKHLDILFIHNKRYSHSDIKIIQKAILLLNKEHTHVTASYIDWAHICSTNTTLQSNFSSHLQRLYTADIVVSSVGTGLIYVPFLRDRSVFINLGHIWCSDGRLFPSFMEQALSVGAVPYIYTLHGDPGKAIRQGKALGVLQSMTHVTDSTAGLTHNIITKLAKTAINIAHSHFTIPRSITDNLSREGRALVELCAYNYTLCTQMLYDRKHCPGQLWPEWVVYEVNGWGSGGACHSLDRDRLKVLKSKYDIPKYTETC